MKGKLLKTFASSAVALSMLVGCSSGSGTAATELKEGDTIGKSDYTDWHDTDSSTNR